MTTEELHKILDDENKKISLEEYQNTLWLLKRDTSNMLLDRNIDAYKSNWYAGETNGFQLALELSNHIIDKDHRITVLERALLNLSKDVRKIIKCFWKSPSELKTEYIKQAEKELKEE